MSMKRLLAAAVFAGVILGGSAASAVAKDRQTIFMVEVLPLKPGATAQQAAAYFEAVSPIIASHGVFPVQSYQVVDEKAGGVARVVNVWRVARQEGLPEIFGDPAYLAHVRDRDAIFDLPARLGWMTRELY